MPMYELKDMKRLRKRLGLTQQELAKKAGVSQSLLAKIETGRISPGYERVTKIFSALDHVAKRKETKAKAVATRKMTGISSGETIGKAIKMMGQHKISQMPVLERGKPVGLLTETGILEKVSKGVSTKEHVAEVMEDAPPTVSEDSGIDAVIGLLRHFPIVLVARKGEIAGVITKSDVLGKMERK